MCVFADGGNFAMDWRNREAGQPDLPADAPTLLVIHGLNGHSEEACVLYSMVCCVAPPVFFRACFGGIVKKASTLCCCMYNSGIAGCRG